MPARRRCVHDRVPHMWSRDDNDRGFERGEIGWQARPGEGSERLTLELAIGLQEDAHGDDEAAN